MADTRPAMTTRTRSCGLPGCECDGSEDQALHPQPVQAVRPGGRAGRRHPRPPGRRIPHPARPFRIRKEHSADDDRRPGAAKRRRHLDRRPTCHLPAAQQARYRRRVPELCAVPAPDGGGEHRLPAAHAQHGPGTDRERSAARARGRAVAARGGALSPRTVRRPAAAHRPRPLHRLPPASHPDGRAAGRTRP